MHRARHQAEPIAVYLALYYTHVICAYVSITGFILRALLKMSDHPVMQQRAVRILPHVVDTLLLASAIGLMLLISQYPFTSGWLTAKLGALIAYILCGLVCLRTGNSNLRLVSFLAAILIFGYMVSVALTHSPYGIVLAFQG